MPVGVLLSMFSAIIITRFLLNRLVGMRVNNCVLYGVKKSSVARTPFRVDTSAPEKPAVVEGAAEELTEGSNEKEDDAK